MVFVGLGVYSIRHTDRKLQLNEIKLQDNNLQLNSLKLEKQKLNEDFEKAVKDSNTTDQQKQDLEKRNLELEQKTKDLEAQLQAKLDAKKANNALSTGATAYAASLPTGSKAEWLAASGIPEDQWWAVDFIVSHESGWKPCAYYPSRNDCSASPDTACGLVQQLPCGKIPGSWTDPVAALKWQYQYVQKYGGYAGAVAYWQIHGNY